MAKTAAKKLTEVDKFYINGNRDKSAAELAKILSHKEVTVKKYLDENPLVVEPVVEVPPKMSDFVEMTCPKDNEGKSRGIAILTHAASEVADASRKTGKTRHGDCIQNIKPKK